MSEWTVPVITCDVEGCFTHYRGGIDETWLHIRSRAGRAG